MNAQRQKLLPLLCAIAACASWLYCTGPCAFGWVSEQGNAAVAECDAGGCSSCGVDPQPAGQDGDSPGCLATCGQLRIAIVPEAAKIPLWDGVAIGWLASASPALHAPLPVIIHWSALDTGPPFAWSFAELVLQKSLLSHAPPRSV